MLYLVGFGLHSYKDISLRGLEAAKNCHKIYLEHYTSIHGTSIEDFEAAVGKKIHVANREVVEQTDVLVDEAMGADVCLLVVGTPMFATTHSDIIIRAKEKGVRTEIIHNASIVNIMGCCGLYSYAFGRTVSIPYFTHSWKPTSFYDNIVKNMQNGLHTLCLLDIRVDEDRFMSVGEALSQILESARLCRSQAITEDTKIISVCRFGSPSEHMAYETIRDALSRPHGQPLHSLIIPASMSVVEQEFVDAYFK